MVSKSLFVMFVVARCHNELDRRICMYRFVRIVLDLEQIEIECNENLRSERCFDAIKR